MPKFARPNSYNGRQSNQNWTGDTRAANSPEAAAGLNPQVYISPVTLAEAVAELVPLDWLRVDTVTIPTADVLQLATTPYELVEAPGAGNLIEFISAELILDYNSIAYTESGDNMAIRYTDGSGVIVSQAIESTGFIDQTADTITNALPKIDAIVAATGAVNQPLVLDNTGTDFAAGNSPIIVKIAYRIITTGL